MQIPILAFLNSEGLVDWSSRIGLSLSHCIDPSLIDYNSAWETLWISGTGWSQISTIVCCHDLLLEQTEEMEDSPRLITLQFTWNKGSGKPIGSSFIGTSPEFELAIYTTMFLMNREQARVRIKSYDIEVVCHRHGQGVGSAFPKSKSDWCKMSCLSSKSSLFTVCLFHQY